MEKLPISIGILSWKSGQTLVNTLNTYFQQEFLHQINDVCILFQEFSQEDSKNKQNILTFLTYQKKII